MANHYSTTSETLKTLLQSTQRVHVDIVSRLVEQQYIALLLQCQRQLQTVALTARKSLAEFALVRSRKVETRDVGTRIHIPATHTYRLVTLRNSLVHRLLRVNILMLLIHVSQLNRLSNLKRTAVSMFQSHNHAEKRSLARTVRTDNTHDAVRRKHEVQVLEQHLLAESLLHMLRLNHLVAKTRTVRDEYLQLLLTFLLLLTEHLLVSIQTSLALSLTSLRSHVCPFQLTLQCLATLRSLLLLLHHSRSLLLQPRRVVAMPRNTLTTVQLQNPFAHIIQEVAVVSHGDNRTLILLQVLLQPVDALRIQMVRRLIQQQHIRLLQQQTAQSHTAALATREMRNRQVALRATQRSHRAVQLRVHVPCVRRVNDVLHFRLALHQLVHLLRITIVLLQTKLLVYLLILLQGIICLLHPLHNVLLHRLRLIQWWVLRQITDRVARTPHHLALSRLVQSGYNLHQCRLTCTIQTDDTYFCTIEERKINVLQYLFTILRDDLRHPNHRENNFLVVYCCHFYINSFFSVIKLKVIEISLCEHIVG